MTPDTAELRRLLAKATPGPWMRGPECEFDVGDIIATDGTPYPEMLPNVPENDDENDRRSDAWWADHLRGQVVPFHNWNSISDDEHEANAALIVAAVNALPALLDAA